MTNTTAQTYDAFSSDYDRFVNWNNRLSFELPFLEEQLSKLGKPADIHVLDAACGTGMHAIALAQRGYRSIGADLSQGMVDRANANALSANQPVSFVKAGFGQLAGQFPPATIDAVLCLGNSLPHLLTPDSLSTALLDFSASLRRDGLLLIQNRNFDAVMTQRERWMEPQSHHENDVEWVFLRFYDYLPDGLIDFHIITLRRESASGWRQQVNTTRLFPLLQVDLTDSLKNAGFDQIIAYGGLDGSTFEPSSSGNLVITARKA
jgi:SAM-dependent methyltransferase